MAAKQAMKENLQCTSKNGDFRISQDVCHVRMTDIEGFLTIYGHSDNLLNNNHGYSQGFLNQCLLAPLVQSPSQYLIVPHEINNPSSACASLHKLKGLCHGSLVQFV